MVTITQTCGGTTSRKTRTVSTTLASVSTRLNTFVEPIEQGNARSAAAVRDRSREHLRVIEPPRPAASSRRRDPRHDVEARSRQRRADAVSQHRDRTPTVAILDVGDHPGNGPFERERSKPSVDADGRWMRRCGASEPSAHGAQRPVERTTPSAPLREQCGDHPCESTNPLRQSPFEGSPGLRFR